MATMKSDVEAVAACDWNDVDHLVQTLHVFSVYHLRETDSVAATSVVTTTCHVSYNIHIHNKRFDAVSFRCFF